MGVFISLSSRYHGGGQDTQKERRTTQDQDRVHSKQEPSPNHLQQAKGWPDEEGVRIDDAHWHPSASPCRLRNGSRLHLRNTQTATFCDFTRRKEPYSIVPECC